MIPTEHQKRFEELLEEMKSLFTDSTTRVRITITAEQTRIASSYRYPEQLKKANINMRNIKGDFIKQQ